MSQVIVRNAAGGTFITLVAYTLPLGALDSTSAALQATPEGRAWIVSAMSLGLAASLLPSGALADARGRKKLFIIGLTVLALASALATLAPTLWLFVLGRILQGLGGAAVTASSLGLVGSAFTDPQARTRATAVWGASLGAGIAAGPLLSAGLSALLDWRAAHAACGVIAAVLAVIAMRTLNESKAEKPRTFDFPGAVLLMLGLSLTLAGMTNGRTGWTQVAAFGPLIAGALFLIGFFITESRVTQPLLELQLFRGTDFTLASVGAFANGLGIIAQMSFTGAFLARRMGWPLLAAAVGITAWSGLSVVTSLAARRLPERWNGRTRLTIALFGVGLGQVLMAFVESFSSTGLLFIGLFIAGSASGLLNATLARLSVSSVPQGMAAMGSGMNNTARYFGAAIGTTLVALLWKPTEPTWLLAASVAAAMSFIGAAFTFRWSRTRA